MPKPEKGTPKWIANQWKKKGLSKLRWHCGLCGVWCKDANGFKMHLEHPNHLARAIEQEKTEDVVATKILPYVAPRDAAIEAGDAATGGTDSPPPRGTPARIARRTRSGIRPRDTISQSFVS